MSNNEISEEIKRADTLCKRITGFAPNISYCLDVNGEPQWTITQSIVLCPSNPIGASLEITAGPYYSLLECICQWNTCVDKLNHTTFFKDLLG